MKNKIKKIILGCFAMILGSLCFVGATFANVGVAVSPMNTRITLNPGETYEGSFVISNPARNDENYAYEVAVTPYYVDDNYNVVLDKNNGDYNQMVDWITVDETRGSVAPNESKTVHYSINVPSDAPAGGQYATIRVGSLSADADSMPEGVNLNVTYGIAYIIYAEVTGSTSRQGEIVNMDVPGFLLSGFIKGTSAVKDTGNVHGIAKYTLQVYPLFSNEEIYTNEENPEMMVIMPDRTYYNETSWEGTPGIGIFNVVYTVDYEGMTQQVKKMVIVCPIWLLFIIIFVVVAIIIFIVMKVKGGKKAKRQ